MLVNTALTLFPLRFKHPLPVEEENGVRVLLKEVSYCTRAMLSYYKANVPLIATAISGTDSVFLFSFSCRILDVHYFALADKISSGNIRFGDSFESTFDFCKISVASCL